MTKLRITVGANTYDVTVEVLEEDGSVASTPLPAAMNPTTGPAPAAAVPAAAPAPAAAPRQQSPAGAGAVLSPMAGLIRSVEVQPGSQVTAGQLLVLLEAMKLENQIAAPRAGTVRSVQVKVGDSVGEGQPLLELE
ncbi:MAG: acetyl-CoA carboxylase biotin carboxyl carrier protein subunit [Actinomycetales bacterium]